MQIKHFLFSLASLFLPCNVLPTEAADEVTLTKYVMPDGSLIRGMSDNGRWALTYAPHPADSYYTYARVIDLSTCEGFFLTSEEEMENGTESQANDITDDGSLVVGSLKGRPAYWSAATSSWTYLPLSGNKMGGRANAVTPDGKYAVGVCTNGGLEEVPAFWDLTTGKLIDTPNLPTRDLWGDNEGMLRFSGISADGRYITGCMDYSYPQCVLYFVYDTATDTWDPIAFDYDEATQKYIPKDDDVLTLDGIAISPNGEWVGGTVHNADDVKHPFRYHLKTRVYESFHDTDDLDKGCVTIDNEGVIYAASPAVSPSRSLFIRSGKYWYNLDELLSQLYGMDFYKYTGYEATGFPVAVSSDCMTLSANAYISEDNYVLAVPEPFSQVCSRINLLGNYTPSIRSGAKIGKLANVELRFSRRVCIKGQSSDVVVRDEAGQVIKTAIGLQVNSSNPKAVSVGFRTFTLETGKNYTLEIPEGTIALEGDEEQTNEAIVLNYVGLGTDNIVATGVSPSSGSTVGHLDMTTNPVVFSFPCDVKVSESAVAYLYGSDDVEPSATLNLLAGVTTTTSHQVMAYPTATVNLFRGVNYRVVLPEGSVTDLSGYVKNDAAEAIYEGSYEQTIVSDNSRIYMENFSAGMNNVMLYDGDGLTPVESMSQWTFAPNVAWVYAADDDYTNTCAVSHSMYVPAGKSDDWMVTPQLFIPDEKCYLTFKAQSYRFAKSDRLKVIIWDADEKYNMLKESTVQRMRQEGRVVVDQTLSPGAKENQLDGDWQDFIVQLDDYAGKKIYIAFVNENEDQSAIFVTDIFVYHDANFLISLSGVAETCIARTEQEVSGKVVVQSTAEPYHSATITLCDADDQVMTTLHYDALHLDAGDELPFAFPAPLQLAIGRENVFTVRVTLQGDTRSDEDYLSLRIKNLSFRPTKRAVLEEFTGMACNNCPLGHLAIEHITKLYGSQFIPLSYHVYTGDPYESGMTDYVQYFLGLVAAPTAIISRTAGGAPMSVVTNDGVDDYSFTSADGTCWTDLVSQSLSTDAEADIALTASYDESRQTVEVDYDVRYALTKENVNVGLLFIVTEDGLAGYQSNKFYTQTDEDLGPWRMDGEYGKSNVPYTFTDVVRALYPQNAYFGKSELIPTVVEDGVDYTGSVTMDAKSDLSYVRNVRNCKVACMMIDRETGSLVNAAQTGITDASGIHSPSSDAMPSVVAIERGLGVQSSQPAEVSVISPDGRVLATASGKGAFEIPVHPQGMVIVRIATASGTHCQKLLLR